MSTALYTGSFDPITKGHLDIIRTTRTMFDRVIVGVGTNPTKKYTFTQEERVKFIQNNILDDPGITVVPIPHGKLTADFAYEYNATIVKGVRVGSADFDSEWLMADINRAQVQGLKTVIIPASLEFNNVSSSAAKELCKLHGKVEELVPLDVKFALERELVNQKRVIITGIIGCGKSTITRELNWHYSYKSHNIDLDQIAKGILFERSEPAYIQLRDELKNLLKIKVWDTKSLGRALFHAAKPKAEENRKLLSHIIHQPLLTRIRSELYGKSGIIIFNGALLVEAGWLHLSNNNVLLLDVNKEVQRERLANRGYSTKQIDRRITAQFTTQEKYDNITKQQEKDRYGHLSKLNTSTTCIKDCIPVITDFIDNIQ